MILSISETIRRFFAALIVLFLLATAMHSANAAVKPADISGFWYTQDREGGVQLYHCATKDGDQICGRFYWFNASADDPDIRDGKNPDAAKRDRPLCHVQFMSGFVPHGDGHYTNGSIYSPRHGATFNADLTLIDPNTLSLHGYVILPVFGDSQTWTRAKQMPTCTAKLPDPQ